MNSLPGMVRNTFYTPRTTCRACGRGDLVDLFSLGTQVVSNFVVPGGHEQSIQCPVDIVLCPACILVQQRHTVSQGFLYRRHYWYTSGTNQTMRDALAELVRDVEQRIPLTTGDRVLDVGANDGTLLRAYRCPGLVRIGVEPADNLATPDNYQGLVLINDFWPEQAVQAVKDLGKVKVVTACGMLYDLEDPEAFLQGVAQVLAPDGLFVAQLMCLKQTLEQLDVGNYAHEHLEFYSLWCLERLLQRCGLQLVDIAENNTNGGSYRLYIQPQQDGVYPPSAARARLAFARAAESQMRLDRVATYQKHYERLDTTRQQCVAFIKQVKAVGHNIWIYGASTKGNVITQWYGLDHTLITAAADRSPSKWGRYMVGSGIRITSEEEFRQANPPYALVLPYSFIQEFIDREAAWRAKGGRFLVPLPEFHIV